METVAGFAGGLLRELTKVKTRFFVVFIVKTQKPLHLKPIGRKCNGFANFLLKLAKKLGLTPIGVKPSFYTKLSEKT